MLVKSLKVNYLKLVRLILIFLIFFVVAFFIYLPNYTRLKKLREENLYLEAEIRNLKKEISAFKNDIEKVENDTFIWEKLARQNLGVIKEGEIVVDIREQEE